MRRPLVARTAAVLGALGAVSAWSVLPWAQYGSFAIELDRFPGWFWYVGTTIVLNLFSGWVVTGRPGSRPTVLVAGYALTAATIVAAVVVAAAYRDGTALFGPIVPAVVPRLGVGAVVAVLAALANAVAFTVAAPNASTVAPAARQRV
ncbi:hypothetical protein [Plantactinospora sonchi]|uniref:Uncharacterized protein n=1 Tax=Plantactinospora sonchi TaxID=1544735 RepID=A0ABU7RW90_9ACTN